MDTATRYTVMREDLSFVLAREYGDTNDSATILAALIDIGADACVLVLNDDATHTWLLDTDVTIPANVTLDVPFGVTVTGAANLTIIGGLIASRVDWFQSTGTLLWLSGAGLWQVPRLHTGPAHAYDLTLDVPLPIDQGGTGARDAPQARINLGLVPGVNVQPYDATLAAFAALNGAANQMFYFTGPDAFGLFNTSIYSMALLGNTNSTNWLAGLGCGDLAILDTVSTLQIDDRAVTLPKLQTLQAARLIGRQAGSVGPAQEISLGAGLQLTTGAVLDTVIQTVAAYRMLGRDATPGPPLEISVSGGLQLSSFTLTLAALGVTTPYLGDGAVTLPKLQTLQAARLIGRQAGSVGPAQEISLGAGLAMSTGGVLDLSGTAIAGTGVDNRVGVWSGAGALTYDNGLIWDRTNHRLGLGGTPTEVLHVFGNILTPLKVFAFGGVHTNFIWIQDATGNRDYAGNPLYAISSGINYIAGQNRYNLNIDGTAHNYIGGNVGLGVLSPTYKLDVTGTGIRTPTVVVEDRAGEPVAAMDSRIAHVVGQNRFNLYIQGTARNFFQGLTGFGMNNPSYAVDVTGTVRSQSFRVENPVAGAWQAYVGLVNAGTERWNLYMLGTASNVMFGPLGVNAWPSTDPNWQLTVGKGIYADFLNLTGTAAAGGFTISMTGNVVMSGGKFAMNYWPTAYDMHIAGTCCFGSTYVTGYLSVGTGLGSGARIVSQFNPGTDWGMLIKMSPDVPTAWATVYRNTADTIVGVISISPTSTNYGTTSDRRLKRHVQPLTDTLATVARLRPITFLWNSTDTPDQGFLADEVQAIIPAAVTGEPDAINPDGTMRPQQMDHSKLVPWLVGAVQELLQRVQMLEGMLEGGM